MEAMRFIQPKMDTKFYVFLTTVKHITYLLTYLLHGAEPFLRR